MLGQIRLHQVPLLRVADKDVHGGLKPTRIVQARSSDADDSVVRILRAGQARTAFGAEAAKIMSAVEARRGVMLNRAFDNFECFERYDDRGNVRPTGDLLAIPAMAFEHHQRLGAAFISDLAANTAACKGKIHKIM